MKVLCIKEELHLQKRLNRIRRYKEMSNKILETFSDKLSRFYSVL